MTSSYRITLLSGDGIGPEITAVTRQLLDAVSARRGFGLVYDEQPMGGAAIDALREAIPAMARKLKGFDQADAVLTGVETRTSSPLRIERDVGHQSPNVRGLYPAGEGAGFAGGILSAAVDGIKVGESVARGLLR